MSEFSGAVIGGVEIAPLQEDAENRFKKRIYIMKKYHSPLERWVLLGTAVALCWGLRGEDIRAAESPLEMIRTTTTQALAVLQDPVYQGKERRQARIRRMWEILLPNFDERAIAQRALGVHWRGLSEEQRTHFTQLFIQLVKNSYSGTLDRYTEDAQFFFDSERIDGDYAEVYTRIETPDQPDAFEVVYRLHQEDGRWLVYDVVAGNVSMVQNYRNQFNRIVNRSSFDGLIQALEDKLKELGVS